MPLVLNGSSITGLASSGGLLSPQSNSVLQMVTSTFSTAINMNSTTFTDTGLTVNITPFYATSKILVMVNVNGCYAVAATTSVNTRLVRNSSTLTNIDAIAGYGSASSSGVGSVSMVFLDSPATTSSTTYKVQYCSSQNQTVYINASAGNTSVSNIIVMEIAA